MDWVDVFVLSARNSRSQTCASALCRVHHSLVAESRNSFADSTPFIRASSHTPWKHGFYLNPLEIQNGYHIWHMDMFRTYNKYKIEL